MAKEVIVSAKKVRNSKLFNRAVKLALLCILLFLTLLYIILTIIYKEGKFTVTLDPNKYLKSGIAIYDDPNDTTGKRKLEAESIKFMDNISFKWLPDNIDADEVYGSHNGNNFIAYTFYVENQGEAVSTYWYEIIVDDVVKNVDEAIRIRVYRNGEAQTYAKPSKKDGSPEKDTIPFRNIKDAQDSIIIEEVSEFQPGQKDRITVVVWLEGDDPDCTDPLIGGELKMHMVITENHTELKEE